MDFKSHRKLYKSGKQWVTSTIFSVAIISGMVLTGQTITAHADTATLSTVSNSTSQPAQTDYQASVDAAQSARDDALASAATSQSAALSANAAAIDAVNDSVESAQNNYNNAVSNAPEVTKTVAASQQAATGSDDWNQLTTTEQKAIQAIVSDASNEYYQSSYPAELAGMYPTITVGVNSTNVFKDGVTSNIVSSVEQLPLTFYPGILQYNPANDTSAQVSGQLTRDQVIELNDLSNSWMNWMRNYIYNTLGWTIKSATGYETYSKDNFQTANNQLMTLSSHLDYFNEAQNVAAECSAESLGYQHSINMQGLDGSGYSRGSQYTYRAMENDSDLTANRTSYAGENLYEISGKTMLQLEVDLYNKMQAMLWSEVLQATPTSTSTHPEYYVSGHLLNALTPYNSEASLATQYVSGDTYYVIWELAGIKYGQALTDDGKETVSSGIIDQITKATTPTSQTYVDYTSDEIVAAQQALTTARQNAQSELSTLEATEDQIKEDYTSAVQAANATYNQALAAATERLNQQNYTVTSYGAMISNNYVTYTTTSPSTPTVTYTPVNYLLTDDENTTESASDSTSVAESVSENTVASASEETSQSTVENTSMATSVATSQETANSVATSTENTSTVSDTDPAVEAASVSTSQATSQNSTSQEVANSTSNTTAESSSTATSEVASQNSNQSTDSTVTSTAKSQETTDSTSTSTATSEALASDASSVANSTQVTSSSQAGHVLPATATVATSLVKVSATKVTGSSSKATSAHQTIASLPQTRNQSTTILAILMASLTSFLGLIGFRRHVK